MGHPSYGALKLRKNFLAVEHPEGFGHGYEEAVEGGSELSHLVFSSYWEFSVLELSEAYAVGHGGQFANGLEDEEVEHEIHRD